MVTRYKSRKGFTLVEILIVVIILGILAAIVIPQFTSASQDARRSSLASTVQSVRSQIELYKLQHGDTLPDLVTNWDPFTTKTDNTGALWVSGSGVQGFGPYMQSIPSNGLTDSTRVADGTDVSGHEADGFVYDYSGGTGTGRFWGVDKFTDDSGAVQYRLSGDAAATVAP
jgi:general secretion pathway protein G